MIKEEYAKNVFGEDFLTEHNGVTDFTYDIFKSNTFFGTIQITYEK